MKFRLSVEPKGNRPERKYIAPSLLSDPAFSADPHAHPYFVTDGPAWTFSPPVGHPTLKHNNGRRLAQHSSIITDFTPAPPPNTPAPPSDISSPAPQPPPILKKRLMPFLSRRKSSSKLPPTAHKHTSLPPFNDVTHRPDPRPVPGARYVSEPLRNTDPRPSVRRAATTGANTPRSTVTAPSMAPTSSRAQDLDRIDELDETNPLGIALHHGGRYEVPVQALRRNAENRMPLGFGAGSLGDYPRQAMHAHANLYVPPQVPPGVSLNLSPGQILPRNFHLQPPYHPHSQDAPKPPQITVTRPFNVSAGPAPSRRISQPLPQPSPLLPNPHPLPNPLPITTAEPRDQTPPRAPADKIESDEASYNIGMAMLKMEASESSNPSIFVQAETPEEEFDPYDPIHLEREHYSRTLSPLVNNAVSPSQRSRGLSPDRKSRSSSPDPAMFEKPSDNPDTCKVSSPEWVGDPPPYPGSVTAHHENRLPVQSRDQSRSSSRAPSPGPLSVSNPSGVRLNDEGSDVRSERYTIQERLVQFGTPAQPNRRGLPMDTQPPVPLSMPMARGSHENVLNTEPPPSMHERERIDGRSIHHSISTYSSSQSRNGGPPPHRRVPKHLVMPAPLNNNNNVGLQQPLNRLQRPPSFSPFAPVKIQVQSPLRSPLGQLQLLRPPLQPVSAPVRAQEIQIAKASKLRKRVSTITPPSTGNIPSAPIITTVSFAAPVIGFGHSADQKPIGLTKAEKVPKRVLSKRRADL